MIIRNIKQEDIHKIAVIEAASYPESEAASEESIAERAAVFPDNFWLLDLDGEIVAFINGMVTDLANLKDEMYENADMHNENGEWQMIFSVVSAPDHRHKGYAVKVMNQVIEDCRKAGRKGIVLTCKEHLLDFYGQFGYINEGVSGSTHGGAVWYQMRLTF